MLAYNWLQLMSQNNAFNISAADRLYSEAMSLLKSSTYRQALRNAYGNVSSEVLNGNICFLSLNQSTCSAYG